MMTKILAKNVKIPMKNAESAAEVIRPKNATAADCATNAGGTQSIKARHEPISQYQVVVKRSPLFTEVLYCDDRDEAVKLAAELGGRAESWNGIVWEPILKVVK